MLAVVLLPIFVIALQQLQLLAWEKEAFERFEDKSLVTISIKQNNISWHLKNKEAIIDGKLFDVKYFSIQADNTILLTGLFDQYEDELELSIGKIISKQSSKRNPSTFHFFSLLYSENFFPVERFFHHPGKGACIAGYINPLLPCYYKSIFIPPPNC